MVDQTSASWNRLTQWLKRVDGLGSERNEAQVQ